MDTTHAVSSIDIATTIYGICDIEPPAGLQGINVLDKEAVSARDLIFAETYAHDFSTIDSSLYYQIAIDLPYKLILPDTNNVKNAKTELFDIVNDPFETSNLVKSNPDIVLELKNKIESWKSSNNK